jgi:hypothetical protein
MAELDRELAAGADPNRGLALRARARLLIAQRAGVASTLQRYLAEAEKPREQRWAPVPVRWDAVVSAAPQLQELARRLREHEPISPQGIARTSLLLSDGTGPLYGRANQAGIWTAARAALLAFDWGPELTAQP